VTVRFKPGDIHFWVCPRHPPQKTRDVQRTTDGGRFCQDFSIKVTEPYLCCDMLHETVESEFAFVREQYDTRLQAS
jgi:hypothetical protein